MEHMAAEEPEEPAGPEWGALAVGMDVGGTWIRAALVDRLGRVARVRRVRTPIGANRQRKALLEVAEPLMQGEVVSIGVGIPGVLRDGRLVTAGNLDLRDFHVGHSLERRYGKPVVVMNDAAAAAQAEWRSQGDARPGSMIYVAIGTGIGGSFVCRGDAWRGRGMAGEVGHMTVDPRGDPCPCGSRGCWELLSSGRALARRAAHLLSSGVPAGPLDTARLRQPDAAYLDSAAHAGDPRAQAAIDQAAGYSAIALNNIAVACDPDVLVVGGGVANNSDLYWNALTRMAARHRPAWLDVEPTRSRRAADAGVVGAALVALDAQRTPRSV